MNHLFLSRGWCIHKWDNPTSGGACWFQPPWKRRAQARPYPWKTTSPLTFETIFYVHSHWFYSNSQTSCRLHPTVRYQTSNTTIMPKLFRAQIFGGNSYNLKDKMTRCLNNEHIIVSYVEFVWTTKISWRHPSPAFNTIVAPPLFWFWRQPAEVLSERYLRSYPLVI